MKNMPTFYGLKDMRKTKVNEVIEEIEDVENQIEWFEKTRVDESKRPRYANVNLKEVPNYSEFLSTKLAAKR